MEGADEEEEERLHKKEVEEMMHTIFLAKAEDWRLSTTWKRKWQQLKETGKTLRHRNYQWIWWSSEAAIRWYVA